MPYKKAILEMIQRFEPIELGLATAMRLLDELEAEKVALSPGKPDCHPVGYSDPPV